MAFSPGWYPDPAEPSTQRYWDGEQWVGKPLPLHTTPPAHPPAATPPAPTPVGKEDHPAEATPPAALSTLSIVRVASLWARLGARIVDLAILLALNLIINGWFLLQYIQEISPSLARSVRIYQATGSMPDVEISSHAQRLSWIITGIMLLLWLAYELPALMRDGQTVGKRFLQIRVIDPTTNQAPRLGGALRRWIILALPLALSPLLALPLWLIMGLIALRDRPARRCLQDFFAHTIVVRAEETKGTKR